MFAETILSESQFVAGAGSQAWKLVVALFVGYGGEMETSVCVIQIYGHTRHSALLWIGNRSGDTGEFLSSGGMRQSKEQKSENETPKNRPQLAHYPSMIVQ
jgi:hypothetical protein